MTEVHDALIYILTNENLRALDAMYSFSWDAEFSCIDLRHFPDDVHPIWSVRPLFWSMWLCTHDHDVRCMVDDPSYDIDMQVYRNWLDNIDDADAKKAACMTYMNNEREYEDCLNFSDTYAFLGNHIASISIRIATRQSFNEEPSNQTPREVLNIYANYDDMACLDIKNQYPIIPYNSESVDGVDREESILRVFLDHHNHTRIIRELYDILITQKITKKAWFQ